MQNQSQNQNQNQNVNLVSSPQVEWFWYDDSSNWNLCEPSLSNELEKNFQNNETSFEFELKGQKYLFDLKSLFQLNLITKKKRAIYRGESVWEWKNNDGSWQKYPKEISDELEKAKNSKIEMVKYDAPHSQQYYIYPLKNYQINIKSQKKKRHSKK